MNSYEETIKIIKWARKQGALLIKVNGVELTFPPDIDSRLMTLPISQLQTSNQQTEAAKAVEFIKQDSRAPSALDDPDYYIREQDSWASHTRPPPIG
jgi:hypothetical protein